MLQDSRCPKCATQIKRFVGMKDPVVRVSNALDPECGEAAWDVVQIEALAYQATDSGNVTIIHLLGDQVAPLHKVEDSG
jgi:hypothetical protein